MDLMNNEYSSPKAYYRHTYFEACDLLSHELENRFEGQNIQSVLAIEQLLFKAANGDDYQNEMALLEESCYKNDIDVSDLNRHYPSCRM